MVAEHARAVTSSATFEKTASVFSSAVERKQSCSGGLARLLTSKSARAMMSSAQGLPNADEH